MPYTYEVASVPDFTGTGLEGYGFGPLRQRDLDIFLVESVKGHDTFVISKKITHTYYVLSGAGYFTIDGHQYDVSPGMLVEVPPRVEYSYSGKMTLLGFARPSWFRGNDTHTRWNPDVTQRDSTCLPGQETWLTRLAKLTIAGRSPVGAYIRVNRKLWGHLPRRFAALRAVRSYGNFVHAVARRRGDRAQAQNTHFLRNRPQLELIRRVLEAKNRGETLRVAVLGCSTGPEAYSVAWRIRSARPDLRLDLTAADISPHAVSMAQRGVYSAARSSADAGGSDLFIRMTAEEKDEFFDWDGETATVKPWIRDGITWRVGDAGEPEIVEALGPQDIVVANNFLCHMVPSEAERCLRNIGRLINPNGYLFVSGVDLAVRTKVARELGWEPVQELLEEIHEGDHILRDFWPWHYTGLEPLDKQRSDWRIRYAAVFQVVQRESDACVACNNEFAAVADRA